MKNIIESPFVKGNASLHKELKIREFRKESFQIWEHYYICDSTGRTFTTPEVDTVNLNQIYNQYREKHGFLFPEQIIELRKNYGLNLVQMSKVLGLGVNMIRNYENGEMPSTSNSTLLNLVRDPKVFKKLLQERYHEFGISDKKKAEIDNNINHLIHSKTKPTDCLPQVKTPTEYTGFIMPNFEKFSFMTIFFLSHLKFLFKTKLNKLLFYSDFYHFKQTGKSISGMQYMAISLGPVPNNYLHLYASMFDREFLENEPLESKEFDQDLEKMTPVVPFNEELFSVEEIEVLNKVLKELGYKPRKDVVQISHEEKCWQKESSYKGIISYQKYAFELAGI